MKVWGMETQPEQPPEGKLIADALRQTGLSIRQAAKRARISYGRWRQITNGYQNVGPGSFAAVRAPAATVARMAAVVGVSAEDLEGAGRADAAESLRELQRMQPADDELAEIEAQIGVDLSPLAPELRRSLLGYYAVLDARMSELERREAERQNRPAV